MGQNKEQQDSGDERFNTYLGLDGTGSSSQASSGGRDDETALPPPSSETVQSSDELPVRQEKNTETPVAENQFETEASRVLFDAIDTIRSCGAGKFIDIPQVGQLVPLLTLNDGTY
jgi:hypothetical protein